MPNATATLWEISIRPQLRDGKPVCPDGEHDRVAHEIQSLAPLLQARFECEPPAFETVRGFLLEGELAVNDAHALAEHFLADTVVEAPNVSFALEQPLAPTTITVLKKPGVMDPAADSALAAIRDQGHSIEAVRTFRRYVFPAEFSRDALHFLAKKILANDAIEQAVFGPITIHHLAAGSRYEFKKIHVPMRAMDDAALMKLSKEGQLYLNINEMRAIRNHFAQLERDPTDIELETLAQTWSEHCSHKTLRGPYELNGKPGDSGLLKDTIMDATRKIDRDWCVSVFADNSGVIKFDDQWNVCFKVETHNHPSAIEPYGGANTGIGGCIRDPIGTGLGAKPICNTDVFCVAPPNTRHEDLPDGVLHPERVLRGIVAGVRDYGNRMGIPTVNGAVCFDERYLGNPLVFCGTVGLIPADKSFGKAAVGDLIVAIGGRTGRDGIHGATFSSGELTTESESVSGGAVQIGNAITEKKVLDIILQARDYGLFNAITDCGAGGFSSAVGEMGEKIGATVQLESAPLKYAGLSYTEIWISEAQERMVLAVPPGKWETLKRLCDNEDVDAFVLGEFEPTGKLTLNYQGELVGELEMHFLHDGRPAVVHKGTYPKPVATPFRVEPSGEKNLGAALKKILGSLNVASKEWIVRQYDHEVQGGSVIKPLTGVADDGPSDAAVITPVLGSKRGLAIGCGINPRYGDADPYRMAASAIDEAIRNVVAVGGDPNHCALLDNFSWGNTEKPEVFGTLCQAAFACRDVAIAYKTPFVSGKDSLYNEFNTGTKVIAIPPTLLISAMAIVPDVRRAITMAAKEAENHLVLVGLTKNELGGSHFALVTESAGGSVPEVDTELGRSVFAGIHSVIARGLVRSCHDLSEGGLAVAAAEMAFAGGLGVALDLAGAPTDYEDLKDIALLFSESNSRFLLEVAPESLDAVRESLAHVPHEVVGKFTAEPVFQVANPEAETIISESIAELKQIWKSPLAW